MPARRKTAFFFIAAWLFLAAPPARAFHDGGSAACDGCHTMHNQAGGIVNPYLLQAAGSSAVCLNCHEGTVASGYRVSTAGSSLIVGLPPQMMTPGGDFAWLKKSYSWLSGGILQNEPGHRHGHNIVAPEFGYQQDTLNVTAPGGTYPASSLHCTSCHDPHGRYRVRFDGTVGVSDGSIASSGSYSDNGLAANPQAGMAVGVYRLLAGAGYQPQSAPVPVFNYDPPAAMAPKDYNRSETATQTRVAYGDGVSFWCANCHGSFSGHVGTFAHPVGETLGSEIASHYNVYVKSGDLSGTGSASFLSLVPFESPLGNSAAERNSLAAMARSDNGNLEGPTSQDRVGCLTCHRAHASGWRNALRWNNDSQLLVYNGNYPGTNTGAPPEYHMGRSESETRRAYYDRLPESFAANQNRLCEKCHVGNE